MIVVAVLAPTLAAVLLWNARAHHTDRIVSRGSRGSPIHGGP
ncbi:MAG: hypothetical protein WKG01_21325 [Kofleriaceae bacterium]